MWSLGHVGLRWGHVELGACGTAVGACGAWGMWDCGGGMWSLGHVGLRWGHVELGACGAAVGACGAWGMWDCGGGMWSLGHVGLRWGHVELGACGTAVGACGAWGMWDCGGGMWSLGHVGLRWGHVELGACGTAVGACGAWGMWDCGGGMWSLGHVGLRWGHVELGACGAAVGACGAWGMWGCGGGMWSLGHVGLRWGHVELGACGTAVGACGAWGMWDCGGGMWSLGHVGLRQLASVAPLRDLHHVKRVRRTGEGRAVSLHVVLTPGSDPLALPEPLLQLVTQHGLEPVVTQVPAHAPRTKERWQEQQSVWPTSFHPPLPGSGAAAPPSTVTPAAATYIQQCFRAIVEKAVKACEGRAGSDARERVTIYKGKEGGRELNGQGDDCGERRERAERVEVGEREEKLGEAVDMRHQEEGPGGRWEEGHGKLHQCGSCGHTEPLSAENGEREEKLGEAVDMRHQEEGLGGRWEEGWHQCGSFTPFSLPLPPVLSSTSPQSSPSHPVGFNMAVIADPSNGQILASAQNPAAPASRRRRLGHPLGHAVMVAIAAAAAWDRALFPSEAAQDKTLFMDGGGEESRGAALSERGGSEAAQGEEKEEREGEQGEGEQRKIELDGEGEEVREAGMEAKRDGKWPPLKRRKGNDVQGLGDPARSAVSPNAPPCSAVRPYLCTGFDAFLLHEPCIMCAMALVHQRVRRVFYAIPSAEGGALGSCWKLHGVKSLNHHYEVFRVDLSQLFSQLPQ
ncbi:unnamed protein product [Closterium sp. NIES-65]|nr:unnamed protein product [Closterium sp. NIES-65]